MTLPARQPPPTGTWRDRSRLWWGAWLWIAAGLLFVLLAVFASFLDRFPLDEPVADALQRIDVPGFVGFIDFINSLGDEFIYVALTLAFVAWFALARRGSEALLVLLTFGVRFLGGIVKDIVDRPRPSASLVDIRDEASGFSFPSGHTVGTAVLFGLLFFLIPTVVMWRPLRWTLQAVCVLAVAAAGPARVYVGVHWPSDVFGGYLLALLFVAPVAAAYLALRRPGTES